MVASRLLTDADALSFRTLRLRALRDHPEAFGASFEKEDQKPVEQAIEHMRAASAHSCILGAFVMEQLVGFAGFSRSRSLKVRHKAHIGGIYVLPKATEHGVGKALLDGVVAYAQGIPDVAEVIVAVTVGNEPARRLYTAAGFEPSSMDPRYLEVGGQYFDIEWMILQLD